MTVFVKYTTDIGYSYAIYPIHLNSLIFAGLNRVYHDMLIVNTH